MYGWNDFSFKNVLGAAYNQVRFIVWNLRYIWWVRDRLKQNALLFSSPLFYLAWWSVASLRQNGTTFFPHSYLFWSSMRVDPSPRGALFSGFVGRGPCLYNVFAQLLLFLSCGECHRPDSKKSEYIFLRHPAPADVHPTACGPPGKKFGHPWLTWYLPSSFPTLAHSWEVPFYTFFLPNPWVCHCLLVHA